jgi:hypothetical protein
MPRDATLFVVYLPNDTRASWEYDDMPKSWKWWYVGGGQISDDMYPREEQHQGPRAAVASMRQYLAQKFSALQRQGTIKRYAIRTAAYAPPKRRPAQSSCEVCSSSGSSSSSDSSDSGDSDWSESYY